MTSRAWTLCAGLVLSVLCACGLNQNGTKFAGSNVGRSIYFYGYTRFAQEPVTVSLVHPQTGGLIKLGGTVSSATATNVNGTSLYAWSRTVVPVPGETMKDRWPEGGLARFRLTTPSGIVTFDDLECVDEAFSDGLDPVAIGTLCGSHDSPNLTFVDTDPLPAASGYLTLRERGSDPRSYYRTIGAPATLALWKSARGFPAGEVEARYYNRGDLGIGREMHCRGKAPSGADVSCYVTNYGSVTDGLADRASALQDAINGVNPVATVAMDYWSSSATNRVRFYVYDKAGKLLEKVPLDSEGAKAVPGLCLSCHGGTYNSATDSVEGARFLPFDLEAFEFPSSGGLTSAPPVFTKQAQQEEFRLMNQLVHSTSPGSASQELIEGWYGNLQGLKTPGRAQDPTFVPPGWSGEEVTYRRAIAPYCRTCHIALPTSAKPYLDFNEVGDVNAGAAQSFVCGHLMPHSELTRALFWSSDARAHLSGTFHWTAACN